MFVRYKIDPACSLRNQADAILARHLFGQVLLDVPPGLSPAQETDLRQLSGRHRCSAVLAGCDHDQLEQWINAGVETAWIPNPVCELPTALATRVRTDELPPMIELPQQAIEMLRRQSEFIVTAEMAAAQTAPLLHAAVRSDRDDGLIPTLVCDEGGTALGLAYSNSLSLSDAVQNCRGTYWSRSRNELWIKGASSGATQRLLRIDVDCDFDTLRFIVDQAGSGFCHREQRNCFSATDLNLEQIERHLASRVLNTDPHSYSQKLLNDSDLLAAKIREEADELAAATSQDELTWEAADLLYFLLVKLNREQVDLRNVFEELDRRTRKTVRRPGHAKPAFVQQEHDHG